MSLSSPFFQSLLMPQIHEEMGAAYRVLDACESQVHRSSDTYFQICVRVFICFCCRMLPPLCCEGLFHRCQSFVCGTSFAFCAAAHPQFFFDTFLPKPMEVEGTKCNIEGGSGKVHMSETSCIIPRFGSHSSVYIKICSCTVRKERPAADIELTGVLQRHRKSRPVLWPVGLGVRRHDPNPALQVPDPALQV